MSVKLLERHIQEYVVSFMELDGWRAFKMEAMSDRGFISRVLQKIRKHPGLPGMADVIGGIMRSCARAAGVGELGMADYLFIRYDDDSLEEFNPEYTTAESIQSMARVLWIELKRPGAKPRPDQIAWKEAEERRGALVIVCDSIEDFPKWYKASGLQRKAIS